MMRKKRTISSKTMMTGMTMKMKFTSLSKSQYSTKRRKKRSHCERHKRRRLLRSAEPNGSATGDCHDPDGVLHMGMDSKQRRNYKYRGSLVRVGHGKVAAARGLHPSGFQEIMVHNPNDLESIDPETQAARVGRTVGGRKRENIHARADELGIRILNRRRNV